MTLAAGLLVAFGGFAFLAAVGARLPAFALAAALSLAVPADGLGGVTLAHAAWLGLGCVTLLRPRHPRSGVLVGVLSLLALIQVFAALWSPSPGAALGKGLVTVAVLCAVLAAIDLAGERPGNIATVLALLAPVVLAMAASIVYFRFDPGAEAAYLRSPLGAVFLGADTLGNVINVTTESKSGGLLFSNGNRAAMVAGCAALVYLAAGIWRRSAGFALVAGVCALAVAASGSKAGLAFLVSLPLFALTLAACLRPRIGQMKLLHALGLGVVIVVEAALTAQLGQVFVEAVGETLSPRRVLGEAAAEAILASPFAGLGFGGWTPYWNAIAGLTAMPKGIPPHNYLLQAGVETGVAGMALTLAALLAWAWFGIRGAHRVESARVRMVAALVASGLLWAALHGLGDNTEFYGVIGSAPLLACGVGLSRALIDRTSEAPPALASADRASAGDPALIAVGRPDGAG